jgi:hypothetical protein
MAKKAYQKPLNASLDGFWRCLCIAIEKFFGKFCKKLGKFHHDLLATLSLVQHCVKDTIP